MKECILNEMTEDFKDASETDLLYKLSQLNEAIRLSRANIEAARSLIKNERVEMDMKRYMIILIQDQLVRMKRGIEK